MMKQVVFILNGERVSTQVKPWHTLLDLLREKFGLKGAKHGCGVGECGACTILMDKKAVNACLLPALEVDGCEITTIEGLAKPDGGLDEVQEAFVQKGAVQCGFCTPGMVMSAKALLLENPKPTQEEAVSAIDGNLCRCTGYQQIIKAILAAGNKS
jgi:aerobic-type carbon monoxide dehydrogenase small subunit (CoxS/CutS family)